ncbi:MAG: peptidylprolyl isomerase [Desulfobacteraceae bacterium]|jgi:peptidyl-prolyl cis-trans isomerase B (cyclophilin B)
MKYVKRFIGLFIVFIAFSAHAQSPDPKVQIQTTMGAIIVELDAKTAPKTVANFLDYVRNGFYDGTIFHRVIKNFMIQGGGFTPDMKTKPTKEPITNEAGNGLKNLTGTIAMARTSAPHSATSQFFINVKDNHFLNHRAKRGQFWGYCVFGKVVKGMEVVKAIETVPTVVRSGHADVPAKNVVIKTIKILEQTPASQ